MKVVLYIFILFTSLLGTGQEEQPLKKCPSSPNCINSMETKMLKRMKPLSFHGNLENSKQDLLKILDKIEGFNLIKESEQYIHYEFSTSIGKYIDDVVFYFDPSTQLIHFRSSSRVGFGDFGANRRRMRKIHRSWGKLIENN